MSSTRNPAMIPVAPTVPAERPDTRSDFDPSRPTPLVAIRFGLGARLRPDPDVPQTPEALLATIPEHAIAAAPNEEGETALRVVGAAQLRSRLAEARKAGRVEDFAQIQKERRILLRDLYFEDVDGYLDRLIATRDDLSERLLLFWTDHFAVSAVPLILKPLVPVMVKEAIRPRIHARFADLLAAAVLHPAMLFYLNQQASVGPNSKAGQRRGAGLNENLAREILELHTLGVDGGYEQRDVEAFARVLTGVKVNVKTGGIAWQRNAAEPGAHTIVGRRFAPADGAADETGMATIRAALDWLASRPQTARFVTGKMVDHFVGPGASASLREDLAATFMASDGDLARVTRALVAAPKAWRPRLENLRMPVEYAVALARAMPGGASEGGGRGAWKANVLRRATTMMGQRMWNVPSPAGWPSGADYWLTAAGLSARLDWAGRAARRSAGGIEAEDALKLTLGGLASPRTRQAILRAPNRTTALSLLFASPEFNRR